MAKRKLIIGSYDTEVNEWTLAGYKLTKGQQAQMFVTVPGRHAPLDFSTYLTDGEPYYGSANLAVTLESSEGTRAQRLARVDAMVNALDGRSLRIIPPDHPERYLLGRVQVQPDYNDLAHCAVNLSAVCDPWLYNAEETTIEAEPTAVVAVGKNLLDLSQATFMGCTYDASTQTVTSDLRNGYYGLIRVDTLNDLILSNLGRPITFSIKEAVAGAAVSIVIYGTRTSGELYQEINSNYGKRSVTITVAEDFTAVRFLEVRVNRRWLKFSDDFTQVSQLQVELGDSATAYEPYHEADETPIELVNSGRLAVTPTIYVTGEITLKQGGTSQALSAGTWVLPWLHLTPGSHWVLCSGDGTAEIVYREAVLAV